MVELDVSTLKPAQLCWIQITHLDDFNLDITGLSRGILVCSFDSGKGLLVLESSELVLGYVSLQTDTKCPKARLADRCLVISTVHHNGARLLVFDIDTILAQLPRVERDVPISFRDVSRFRMSNLTSSLKFDLLGLGSGIRVAPFWLYPHPLVDETYRVWVPSESQTHYGRAAIGQGMSPWTLNCLLVTISLSAGKSPTIRHISSVPWFPGHRDDLGAVGFSGHTQLLPSRPYSSLTGPESYEVTDPKGYCGTVKLGEYHDGLDANGKLSAAEYSGTWAYAWRENVGILYFE